MAKTKYKFGLFDWDGCLADTLSNAERIYIELAARQGAKMTHELFLSAIGDWEKSAVVCGYQDLKHYQQDYNDLVQDSIDRVKLNPNSQELLAELRQHGIKIAVVTSSSKEWILKQAKNNGIPDLIDVVVGYEDVTNIKPDPEPIFKAIELLRGNVAEAIMVGDTEKDILAAQSAGVDSVLYSPHMNDQFYGPLDFDGHKPTYEVADLIEIKQLFV